MKQSIIVIMMFVLGCIIGDIYAPNWDLHNVSMMILYALMFQVGLSVGCSPNLKAILRNFKPKMLLLPLATISGTLLFSAIISVALVQWRVTDCMAVGSGMGYYSLSSILITQLKVPTLGQQVAAELGTIALLANICREMTALICAPLIHRIFGPLATVTAAGVTSVDVCLPAITHTCGEDIVPIALFHGMLIDMSVPLLVPFLCEL